MWRVFFERHHPVHRFQRTQYNHAVFQRVDRTGFTFQTFSGSIAVHRHNQAIAQLSGIGQIRDVTGMQNVEDAVGHHHFFTALTGLRHGCFQLGLGHYAKAGFGPAAYRVFQLDW
ncbi:hypothetical protein D3C73_1063020 [compost metagenome]